MGRADFLPSDAVRRSPGPSPGLARPSAVGRRGPGRRRGEGVSACTRRPASILASHPPKPGCADPTPHTRGQA